MKNTDLQPRDAVRTPPRITPAAKAADETAEKALSARFLSGPSANETTISECPVADDMAAPTPLHRPGRDQDELGWRQSPGQRRQGEDEEPDAEQLPSAVQVRHPSAQQEEPCECEAIGADYLLAVCQGIPSSVLIVGSAICTMEKSSTMTNWAITSSPTVTERFEPFGLSAVIQEGLLFRLRPSS
jgi:hypothetical protein